MNNSNHPPAPSPAPAPREDNGSGPGYGQGYGYGNGYGASARSAADFSRTWHALLERSWIVALTTAVLLGIGYAYLRKAPVLYSATATVAAEQDQQNILGTRAVQNQDIQAVDYLQTVAQSLTSRPLLERMAETNQLWTDPRFLAAPQSPTNRGAILNAFEKLWPAAPPAATPVPATNHARILNALEKIVAVKLRRGTRLIDITVTHRVPELAERIANSIVTAYVSERAEREDSSIGNVNASLAKEAERLRTKLEQSVNALQTYKEESKSPSLEESQNTVVAKLKEMSTKSTEAKSVRITKETEYAQVLNLGSNIEALMTVPAVAEDPTVLSLQSRLTQAENDFAALAKRYRDKHPKYVQSTTQIAELRTDVTNAVVNAVKTLKAGLDSAKAAEVAIDEAMQTQEAAALELSKLSIQYGVLAREVESDRTLYDAVLRGMKEAWVNKETQQGGIIRLVQPAHLPELPVSPRKTAIMAMSGMAGIFLGVLLVMGLRVTDTSIKTVDEAETILGLSVFSVVPHMRGLKNGHSRLVVSDDAGSEVAEAFRTLRTSFAMLGRAEERRVFLFTSAMPSEGKTFCSINYAASLAQLGHKTLLIDADLRKPAVEANLLGGKTSSVGITDYLTGQKKLDQVIQPSKVANLFFISGGSVAVSPAELVAKDGLTSLIQIALQGYDRVVIDSAPINAVSDTLLMCKSVQTVCLVVRASYTSSRYVFRCVQLLQSAEASLAGIVLNRMPQRRRAGYGAYYDYQHHGKYGKNGVYGNR